MNAISTRSQALALMKEVRKRLEAIYGPRLRGVYLFGSFARDEADADSDTDVAIVLSGTFRSWDERKRLSDMVGELCAREGVLLNLAFLTEREFTERPYAIHRSIAREGIPV